MAALPNTRIDRSSPVPFYFQLKKVLAQEIAAGRWEPGDRIPSEPEICEHFQLSRTTVRQALAEMEAEGLILREKGRGTFVAPTFPELWFLQSSHGFYDEAARKGHQVSSRVLRCEVTELPSFAAEALQLEPGTPGLVLERLRWVDGRVVMYVVNYLLESLADCVKGADLEGGSLYRALAGAKGLTPAGGRRVVEAITAEEELAELLEVDEGSPLLFVESVAWDEEQVPFEFYRAWHRADRTKIEVQVINHAAAIRGGLDPSVLRLGV
ncbi:MAG: phosphonate metabolism transcriptional regulator PhnF [Acidimicrobiia bacterium]|nr:MAG: phosphonate metabolism transcriptional regulator PhnF [Acidimicrobiia bacterium]